MNVAVKYAYCIPTYLLRCYVLLAFISPIYSQAPTYHSLHDIEIAIDGKQLKSPLSGGLAMPQFSKMDLDGEGGEDLVVFDRIGEKLLTFINEGGVGEMNYRYDPSYEAAFPPLNNFTLLIDYNCDGLKDIFTTRKQSASQAQLLVYRATQGGGDLQFEPAPYINLFQDNGLVETHALDLPAFSDINGDGDLDILHFPRVGNNIFYYENQSVESGYGCDSLIFELREDCWGLLEYTLSGLKLEFCDGFQGGGELRSACNGSALLAYDFDDDKDKDLVYSSLTSFGISYLKNDGIPEDAIIKEEQINFLFDSSRVLSFPASFMLDIDNDDKLDIAVSSNRLANVLSGETEDRFYFFRNIGNNTTPVFEYHNNHLLIDEALDEGFRSSVGVLDYNLDGLPDIVVAGNYKHPYFAYTSQLNLYQNTGDAKNPRFVKADADFAQLKDFDFKTIHPAFGDIDNDGDTDMVVGNSKGDLHYFENIAAANQLVDFRWRMDVFEGIDVGQNSRPQIVDLDRDGRNDLVVGGSDGRLHYIKQLDNSGSLAFEWVNENWGEIYSDTFLIESSPFIYSDPKDSTSWLLLNATQNGTLEWYDHVETDEPLHLRESNYAGIDVGSYASLFMADLNADGRAELLLGNERGGLNIYSPEEGGSTATIAIEAKGPAFQVFPNPAKDFFTIQLNQQINTPVSFELFNSLGQSIQTGIVSSKDGLTRISTKEFSSGIYWCTIDLKGDIFTERIIIP